MSWGTTTMRQRFTYHKRNAVRVYILRAAGVHFVSQIPALTAFDRAEGARNAQHSTAQQPKANSSAC